MPDTTWDASLGFYRVWLAAIGTQHGLLPRLRDRTATPASLARALGLRAGPVHRWCEAAQAVGLVTRVGTGSFRLAGDWRGRLGRPDHADDLGHHYAYLAAKSLGFGAIGPHLRGRTVRPQTLHAAYATATRWDHLAFFERVVPRTRGLAARLKRGCDVLDLGAGDGGWTTEGFARFPASRFVAADRGARPAGLRGRRVRWVDLRKGPPQAKAFDVVYLGEVLSVARSPARVAASVARSLRPGGRLFVAEGIQAEPGMAPRDDGERLVRAMAFDFGLDGSRFLTRSELEGLLEGAGLVGLRVVDLGGGFGVVGARAP